MWLCALLLACVCCPFLVLGEHGSSTALTSDTTVELAWSGNLVPGVPQSITLTITSIQKRKPVSFAELNVVAARRAHLMVASCSSFGHLHAEDFLPAASLQHINLPEASAKSFQVWLTFPTAGRYVVGVEFVPADSGAEQVAYMPLQVGPTDQDSACTAGPSLSVSHTRAITMETSGVHVASVLLPNISLPEPDLNPGAAAAVDGFTTQLSITPAGTGMQAAQPADSPLLLPPLVVGRCYRLLLTVKDYATGQPVQDLVPFLTHTMHVAVVPVHSLWTLDHFHAMAGDMQDDMDGMDPCDRDDDDMPPAPDSFGPMLTAYYRFTVPGTYRLIGQAVRSQGRMLLPSFVVRVGLESAASPL